MKSRTVFVVAGSALFVVLVFWVFFQISPQAAPEQSASTPTAQIARGKYLVMVGGCEDCHSPKVMTPMGPIPDSTKRLSGAPSGSPLPEMPTNVLGPTKWGAVTTNDLTTWAGPWGVSFAFNLTPDPGTGIGGWTEDIFIKTLRTGKIMGVSRDILPPMPWQTIGQMTDDDLRAIFAYLKSLEPVNNLVHEPLPPPAMKVAEK